MMYFLLTKNKIITQGCLIEYIFPKKIVKIYKRNYFLITNTRTIAEFDHF